MNLADRSCDRRLSSYQAKPCGQVVGSTPVRFLQSFLIAGVCLDGVRN